MPRIDPEPTKWALLWRDMTPEQREETGRLRPELCALMKRDDLRNRAYHSFWAFLSEVIGNPVLYEPLHRPIAEWLEPQNWTTRKKLFLMHRGGVKSNVGTVAYALWRIVRNPNIRILVGSHKDDDGEKFVTGMQAIIENNDVFKDTFPEIRYRTGPNGKAKVCNTTAFLIDRDADFIEPTVQASSPRSSVTGRHYNLFIGDDLVNEKSVNTPELIEKTAEFRRLCQSLLDPGADEIIIGTRYHYEDEYGRILDTRIIRNQYDVKIIPDTKVPGIVTEYIDGSRTWKPEDDYEFLNFPTRFTLAPQDYVSPDGDENKNKKSLPATRIDQGSLVYANQYQLEPRDPTDKAFNTGDIEEMESVPEGKYTCYQFLDHASEKVTQSKSAIVTTLVNDAHDIIIIDVFWGTYSNREVSEELVRWQQGSVRPFMVGVENGPYEISLKAYVKDRQRELGVFIPFKTITGQQHNVSKDDHIRKLTPYVEQRKVKILSTCRNKNQILDEFDKFPRTAMKDCIDALAQIVDLVLPIKGRDFINRHQVVEKEKPRGMTMDDLIERMQRKAGVHTRKSKRSRVRFS